MATARLHTVSGSGAQLGANGWTIHETAQFFGLVGSTEIDLASQAYGVLINNGYFIGRIHPYQDIDPVTGEVSPIVLDHFDFNPLSIDSQRCTIVWRSRRNGPIRAQFSTGAVMEQTNIDINGNPIILGYEYPDDPEIYGEKAGQTEKTGAMVDKFLPERTIEITRTEWGPTYGYGPGQDISQVIWSRKYKYENHVNVAPWHPVNTVQMSRGRTNIAHQPPTPEINTHCWLCTGINATTNDNGVTYDVAYAFAFRDPISTDPYIGGWDAEAIFIDPATGRPPGDIELTDRVVGTGGDATWRVVKIYKDVDFSQIWTGV